MKRIMSLKLLRKCTVLLIMLMCLIFITTDKMSIQTVRAAPCCETCPGEGDPAVAYEICGISCNLIFSPGSPQWQQCVADCQYSTQSCYNHCVYCDSNSGPGGDCFSSSDCPIGYYCGSDNTCQIL